MHAGEGHFSQASYMQAPVEVTCCNNSLLQAFASPVPIIADAAVMASVKNVSPRNLAYPTPGPVQTCLAVPTRFWPVPYKHLWCMLSYMWRGSAMLCGFRSPSVAPAALGYC